MCTSTRCFSYTSTSATLISVTVPSKSTRACASRRTGADTATSPQVMHGGSASLIRAARHVRAVSGQGPRRPGSPLPVAPSSRSCRHCRRRQPEMSTALGATLTRPRPPCRARPRPKSLSCGTASVTTIRGRRANRRLIAVSRPDRQPRAGHRSVRTSQARSRLRSTSRSGLRDRRGQGMRRLSRSSHPELGQDVYQGCLPFRVGASLSVSCHRQAVSAPTRTERALSDRSSHRVCAHRKPGRHSQSTALDGPALAWFFRCAQPRTCGWRIGSWVCGETLRCGSVPINACVYHPGYHQCRDQRRDEYENEEA